jgi:hypothetical protein
MELTLDISETIDPVAIYAAFVSTALLLWDVVKWWRSGPILKGSLSPNMATIGMGEMDEHTFVSVDIDNVGNLPTTIKGAYLKGYDTFFHYLIDKPSRNAFIKNALPQMYGEPFRLEVGRSYKTMLRQDDVVDWSRQQRLYVEVVHTGGRRQRLRVPELPTSDSTKSNS